MNSAFLQQHEIKFQAEFIFVRRGLIMQLLLFAVLLFSAPSPATAVDCACLKSPNPSTEEVKANRKRVYDKAAAIFAGKVVALDGYSVTFKLEKLWKGEFREEIVLSTGAVTGIDGTPLPKECGYQFHLGEEYLVYAFGAPTEMEAGVCANPADSRCSRR